MQYALTAEHSNAMLGSYITNGLSSDGLEKNILHKALLAFMSVSGI